MAFLNVVVKPGAKSNSFGFDPDGRLWVRIAAPATENKANEACHFYLAEILGIKRNQIRLNKGHTHRNKGFELDLPDPELEEILRALRLK